MRRLLGYLIKRPLLVNVLMVFSIAIGVQVLRISPFSAFPNFERGLFIITTVRPGSGPEDIELSITSVLEHELIDVDRVRKLTSTSMEGLSTVLIHAHDDASTKDLDAIERDLERAIDRSLLRLPDDLKRKPDLKRVKPEETPILQLLVWGNVSEDVLRSTARLLQDELRQIEGVAGIYRSGFRDKEVHILLSPSKMHRLGVTHEEVGRAIRRRNVTESAGSIESPTDEREVIARGEFRHPLDVADVVVRSEGPGNFLRVGNIATVVEGYEEWTDRTHLNGKPGIGLNVKKSLTANEPQLVREIEARVEQFSSQLPPGVEVTVVADVSRFTQSMIDMTVDNMLVGMVLVVLVLILFFPLRSALWVAAGLPTAVFLGFALMPLFGLTVNQVTLSAVVLMLGLLVDDAIVTSESIFRKAGEGLPPRQAALEGTLLVMPAVVTGALTTFLAFAPLAFLGGLEGKFMWMLPMMVILIIGASLLESQLILPAHIAHSLGGSKSRVKTPGWFMGVEAFYSRQILSLVRHRYLSILVMTVMVSGLFVGGLRTVSIDLYPDLEFELIYIKARLPGGSSFENTYRELRALELAVREFIPPKDLEHTTVTVGHQYTGVNDGSEEGRNPAWGLVSIMLKPGIEREITSFELIKTLRSEFASAEPFTEVRVNAKQLGPPTGQAVEALITTNGADRSVAAARIMDFLRAQQGIVSVWSNYDPGRDVVHLVFDHDAIASYGLSVLDIQRAIRAAFDGYVIDELQTVDERIRYRQQYQGPERGSAEFLESLFVVTEDNERIPLRAVVSYELRPGASAINHYFGKRSETVFADADRSQVSLVEINTGLKAFVDSPAFRQAHPDIKVQLLGEIETQRSAVKRFLGALMIILLGIYTVMLLLFRSLTQPLLVLIIIPMGFTGVLMAFSIHGFNLSVSAIMGSLGLSGVLVNSAVVLIDHINRQRTGELLSDEEIATAANYRLRPILVTTLTTAAGLAPAAYGLMGANAFLTPTVMAMLWGILFGTLLTLFYLPCLYAMDQDLQRLRFSLRATFAR